MTEALQRAEVLLGAKGLARLAQTRFILFGAGGVGSWCAEGLIRTGARHLTLVDGDVVCASNINRQLEALPSTLGQPKTEALRARLLEIAPDAVIEVRTEFFNAENAVSFKLNEYDCVLDAIDSVESKALLIRSAEAADIQMFASMGAALKFDPSQIRIATLSKVQRCGLAKALRRELKKSGAVPDVTCVYSEETPGKHVERGSLVQVTAPFGFAMCSLAVGAFTR